MHSIIINLVSALKCERAKNIELQSLLKAIQQKHSAVDSTVRKTVDLTVYKRERKKKMLKTSGMTLACTT